MKELERLRIPNWLPPLYGLIALGLLPWIITLSYTLPAHHITRHWDLTWVGFDVLLLAVLVVTAILGFRRSGWIVLSAVAASTMLVVDVWFDILSSRPGQQLISSVGLAVGIEIPLAVVSFWLAFNSTRQILSKV